MMGSHASPKILGGSEDFFAIINAHAGMSIMGLPE